MMEEKIKKTVNLVAVVLTNYPISWYNVSRNSIVSGETALFGVGQRRLCVSGRDDDQQRGQDQRGETNGGVGMEQKYATHIGFRASPAEKKKLEMLAERTNRRISDVLRVLIRRAVLTGQSDIQLVASEGNDNHADQQIQEVCYE